MNVGRVGLAVAVLLAGSGVQAATLRVPSEYSAISLAIGAASAGDTVLVAPGAYSNCDTSPCTASVAELFEGLTLLSEAGPAQTRLEFQPAEVAVGAAVEARFLGVGGAVVEGFEIGSIVPSSRGMLCFDAENVVLRNCRFVGIASSLETGGGLAHSGGAVEVIECEFIQCTAALEGGAVVSIGDFFSQASFRDCVFVECGPAAVSAGGGGEYEFLGCTFERNFGTGESGGLTLGSADNAHVADCVFIENTTQGRGGGISAGGSVGLGAWLVERCLFLRNAAASHGGGVSLRANVEVRQCTFVGNESPIGSGARAVAFTDYYQNFDANVFALNSGSPALSGGFGEPTGDCNVFWENPGSDYTLYTPGPNDQVADPEFCNIPNDDYTVRSTSPCAEENSPVCGPIGAYGIGCGTVSVEATSWSRVKSWYRDEE